LNDTLRLFVAVPLDDGARAAVEAIVDRVRASEPAGRGVRWVRLDGLHLTLRFLGPTSETRIAELHEVIHAAANAHGPIQLRISGSGAFPSSGRPRALWLGVEDERGGLSGLAGRLDDALAGAGWAREERPFRPHLTLARADGVRAGPATVAALAEAARDVAIDARVERIVLFESVTGGGPARYVSRAEAALG
jgi:RNA 2',3'-cyclic 3'-phosphodiesterase